MHESRSQRPQVSPSLEQVNELRPQPKTISLYPPDLERLMRLCQMLSSHTGRSVSASAMVRVALRKLDQNWARKLPPSEGDDVA